MYLLYVRGVAYPIQVHCNVNLTLLQRIVWKYSSITFCSKYWCIDGKYIIDVAMLRNGGKRSFSESVHPFPDRGVFSLFSI